VLKYYLRNLFILMLREYLMAQKVFSLVVIVVAIAMGVLASVLPSERLADLVLISKFFLSMVPVLLVGALIKYLIRAE